MRCSAHSSAPSARLRGRDRTAANSLSLAMCVRLRRHLRPTRKRTSPPTNGGAPGFFSGGAQLALLPGEARQTLPGTFAAALSARPG